MFCFHKLLDFWIFLFPVSLKFFPCVFECCPARLFVPFCPVFK
uniref:Uncharacterized protein n=1 Tax=Anguilla anguilla TaxID=7936 RepID=A0A0E9UVS7_ANGAN